MNPLNESPSQPNEPPKQPPSIPQPADVWPAPQEATGDVEPTTQPTVSFTPPEQEALVEQPLSQSAATAAATPLGSKVGRNKKKRLFAMIIILALIVLGAASVAAYTWYQNPQKVVTDSIAKLLTAKTVAYTATVDSKSDASKLTVALDGAATQQMVSGHAKATVAMGAASVVVEGNVVSDKDGNLYIKLVNAKDIAATLLQGLPAQLQPTVDAAVAKINDKWIKLTPADLNTTTSADVAKVQQCYRTALNKFQTDAGYRSDVIDQYSKHQFIAIKQNLGEKDGSLGYKLAVDAAKEKAFIDGATHTKLYADMQKCDPSFKLDSGAISSETTGSTAPEVELWAEKWSHNMTKFVLANPANEKKDTYSVVVNPKLNQNLTIDTPKDAMTLDQLKTELAPLLGGMFGATSSTTSAATEGDATSSSSVLSS